MTASPSDDSPTSGHLDTSSQRPASSYSANIALIVVVIVVMGGATLIADGVGAGASTVIAGFTAIFFTLGVGGGSLRADLRKVAWYGPLTALSASVPRILAEYNQGVGLALVCVVIFVAGLLPVLGKNYAQAGMGLGFATVLGFSLQVDNESAGQTVVAAFIGVGFVVALRVLMKLRDPSDVTRRLVAETLTDTEPAFGQAYTMWLRDKPVRWLHENLQSAAGYRTLRSLLHDLDATTSDLRAVEVAAVVEAREPAPIHPDRSERSRHPSGAEAGSDALHRALQTLDRIEVAARARNTDVVPGAAATRRVFALASGRSALTWQSQTLRHALRTAFGVLLTFLVAWVTVGSHDPLVTSMAMASFAILQISWTQSLFKAKQRVLGVTGGAVVLAAALWVLPPSLLLPLSLLAALTGLWFVASNQVLSIGSFVVVAVGMNVVGRGLDPTRTLVEYILLMFTGVTIGLLIGFAVVPQLRPRRVDERVRLATLATTDVLRSIALLPFSAPQTSPRAGVPESLVGPLFRMRTAVVNLGSLLNRKDEQAGIQVEHCAALATRFETLAIVALLEAGEGRMSAQTLNAAADALDGCGNDRPGSETDEANSADFVKLADGLRRSSAEFVDACAQLTRPP